MQIKIFTFPVPLSPPAFTESPAIQSEPVIGEAMLVDPAAASGPPDPEITYQWSADSADIAGAVNLVYTPVSADYGAALEITATASNGQTPDDTETVLAGNVGATFEEKFLYDDDVNLPTSIQNASTLWDEEGFAGSFNINTNASSPTGRALSISPTGNSTTYVHRSDIDALLSSAASPASKTDYVEFLYVISANDSSDRTWIKAGGAVGFNMRFGVWRHQLSNEDESDLSGDGIGSFSSGETVVVRHRMDMPRRSRMKTWIITDAEPSDWDSDRNNPSDFTAFDVRIGTDFDGGGTTPNELWYFSVGANTPAPEDESLGLIAPTGIDTMAYAASTDDGPTSSITVNGDFTFEFEDNA